MEMKKPTKQILFTPMSGNLINAYFDGKANIKSVEEMNNYTNLDQVFEGRTYVIIFIALRAKNDGHWVVLIKNSGNLYYFDSYGRKPLIYIKEIGFKFNQNLNLLTLIKESGIPFFYNKFEYQTNNGMGYSVIKNNEEREFVATCGRYATTIALLNVRCVRENIPFNCKVFYDMMISLREKYKITFDAIVSNIISETNNFQ